MTGYAELHALSNFSFLRGASHPEELVASAARLGYRALALTDECSLAGVVRFHQAARNTALQPIIGSELQLDDGLPGCLLLWLMEDTPRLHHGAWLAGRFAGRCWLALSLRTGRDDAQRLARARRWSRCLGLPLLAVGGVWMHDRQRRYLQDTLTAIRLGVPLARTGLALAVSGERHLRALPILQRRYPTDLLAETLRVAARCRFSLDELRYEYPRELVPPGRTPTGELRRLTLAGMHRRWPAGTPLPVRRQLARELALIASLRCEPYFLTVADIVGFARTRGILCQGRGSAANSAVCYALGITEVDPTRSALLFERFISRERDEPPISTSTSSTSAARRCSSTSTANTAGSARRWPPR